MGFGPQRTDTPRSAGEDALSNMLVQALLTGSTGGQSLGQLIQSRLSSPQIGGDLSAGLNPLQQQALGFGQQGLGFGQDLLNSGALQTGISSLTGFAGGSQDALSPEIRSALGLGGFSGPQNNFGSPFFGQSQGFQQPGVNPLQFFNPFGTQSGGSPAGVGTPGGAGGGTGKPGDGTNPGDGGGGGILPDFLGGPGNQPLLPPGIGQPTIGSPISGSPGDPRNPPPAGLPSSGSNFFPSGSGGGGGNPAGAFTQLPGLQQLQSLIGGNQNIAGGANILQQLVGGGGQQNLQNAFSQIGQAQQAQTGRNFRDIREQFSASGLRDSTDLAGAFGVEATNAQDRFVGQIAPLALQAGQQLNQQMLGAGSALGQLGLGQQGTDVNASANLAQAGLGQFNTLANLQNAGQGRQLQASLGLPGSIGQAGQLPLGLAQQGFGLGEGARSVQDQDILRQLGELQRTSGSLFQPLLSFFSGTPQIVGQGLGSQLLGAGVGGAGAAAGAK